MVVIPSPVVQLAIVNIRKLSHHGYILTRGEIRVSVNHRVPLVQVSHADSILFGNGFQLQIGSVAQV